MTAVRKDELEPEAPPRVEALVAIAALALLIVGSLIVLEPFFSAILWAVLLCFSTWQPYLELKRVLRGRRSIAALVMTLMLAAIAVLPFVIVGQQLAGNVAQVIAAIKHAAENGPPAMPEWIRQLPLAGPHIHDYLTQIANDPQLRRDELHNLIGPLKEFAVTLGKSLGRGILEISLSLLVCFFLYRDGDRIASRVDHIAYRIAGERGRRLLEVASVTVSGVVQGIIGTSLVQGVLGGVGFWVAGVPGAFFLGFTTFVFAFIPMAPVLLWIPAVAWLFEEGAVRAAIFLIVWSLVVGLAVEHVLKPIIISRTGTTPIILVMLGVIGGALAFGFIGLFIGPTLLAVLYSLLDEWSGQYSAV
jgi:predicted PurR-regulated permease PerM